VRRGFGVLLCAFAATAVVGLPAAHASNAAVNIQNFSFQPQNVTVSVGDTVTWTMEDANTQHTVTSDDNPPSFNSPTLNTGQTFSHTFNQAGTFSYHCNIHQSMTGKVTVMGGSAQPPPTPAPGTGPAPNPQPAPATVPAQTVPRTTVPPTTAAPTTTTSSPTTTIAPPAAADAGTTSSTLAAAGGGVALPAQKTSSGGGGGGLRGWLVALAVVLLAGDAAGGVLIRQRATTR